MRRLSQGLHLRSFPPLAYAAGYQSVLEPTNSAKVSIGFETDSNEASDHTSKRSESLRCRSEDLTHLQQVPGNQRSEYTSALLIRKPLLNRALVQVAVLRSDRPEQFVRLRSADRCRLIDCTRPRNSSPSWDIRCALRSNRQWSVRAPQLTGGTEASSTGFGGYDRCCSRFSESFSRRGAGAGLCGVVEMGQRAGASGRPPFTRRSPPTVLRRVRGIWSAVESVLRAAGQRYHVGVLFFGRRVSPNKSGGVSFLSMAV